MVSVQTTPTLHRHTLKFLSFIVFDLLIATTFPLKRTPHFRLLSFPVPLIPFFCSVLHMSTSTTSDYYYPNSPGLTIHQVIIGRNSSLRTFSLYLSSSFSPLHFSKKIINLEIISCVTILGHGNLNSLQ